MQFTQIRSPKTFKQGSSKPNSHLNSTFHDHTQDYHIDLREALENIEQLNFARSLPLHQLSPQTIHPQQDTIPASYTQSIQKLDKLKNLDYNNPNKKSTIFASKSSKLKVKGPFVKVYYFGLPISKFIKYDKSTTAYDLIESAIISYSTDANLDQSKLITIQPNCYQFRFNIKQDDWCPDLKLDAIHPSRLVAETFFEQLVLILKLNCGIMELTSKKMRKNSTRPPIKIIILNQLKQNIGFINLNWEESIEQVYKFIQNNGFNLQKHYLAQQINEQFQIPRNYQIKHLTNPKIYVKSKIYLDDGEQINVSPFYLHSKQQIKSEQNFIPPIGITEASMYEEFEVSKNNSFGRPQQRILGIDQQKIYNYEKQVRKNNKQVGFFQSFLGFNKTTGTKRPYRLINEIISISSNKNQFTIDFKDKSTTYKIDNQKVLNKVIRKLSFLVNYHNNKK